ncbi:MAG: histidine phosphatase family protein [Sphingobacteriaceae bacterium]
MYTAKTFYIIRHGETDLNSQGIIQGRGMNTDLNEKGKAQAAAFFNTYQHIPFDVVYTSTLKRTHQTVARFIEKDISWKQHAGLDELAWGIYEGKPSEVTKPAFLSLTSAWLAGAVHEKFEGGESPLEVQERQLVVLEELKQLPDVSNVLICMHGRALRIFLCLLSDLELSKMDSFPHSNTTLYKVYFTGKNFEIQEYNNTQHLV